MLGDLKSWKDLYTEAYLKPCQISNMECFAEILND